MIQRKAPDKPKSSIDHKKMHGGYESQASSRLPQDTKTSGGADLKKKLEKGKSNKAFDFDCFEQSPMDIQFKNISACKKISSTPIRNYMKPTSSSDARKEKLQVTVTSLRAVKNSNSSFGGSASPRAVKALSRQSSLKAVKSSMKKSSVVALCAKKNANRATCSSTLKNSKFPAALELNHGATEAEGTSKIRVCPYTYCSLNGHMHEPLPPLKYFISARRNLLKTQRSCKAKRLFSVQTSPLENEGEMIDDGELEDEIGENSSDLFVEIYTRPPEETILEEKYREQCMPDEVQFSGETKPRMNDSSYINFGYDYVMDQNSEFSQDEMDDVLINFLEYVEFDHARTTAQKDSEEDGEIKNSEIETMDMNWDEEICLFPDNTEISDCPDEQLSVNTTNSYATTTSVDAEDETESEEGNSHVIEKEDSDTSEFSSQSIDDEDQKLPSEVMNCHSDECCLGDDSINLEKVLQEASNGTDGDILNVAAVDYKEIDGILNSRRNFTTQKRTTEELEQVKEFNPRPPNFLPLEPDPEAEKVDLRHQIMDERRNSEEWMIDYALQRAVTKLGPARKKKVALLVQAFETITPLSVRENCLSHGTPTFNHLSFIQACN